MTEHRWSKFWWQDWSGDKALRLCSLAARGLWMEMLCLAHEGDPYGHLTVNGRNLTARQIATLAGSTEKEVSPLLTELEDAGVFSRSPSGTILSRRMVRDATRSEMGRENIAKRGDRPHPRGSPTSPPSSPPSTLEAESEAKAEEPSLRSGRDAAPDARQVLFSEGLAILRELSGKSRDGAAKLLGMFLRDAGDDCAAVMGALLDAKDLGPAHPVSWLTEAVKVRTGRRQSSLDRIDKGWDLIPLNELDANAERLENDQVAPPALRRIQ